MKHFFNLLIIAGVVFLTSCDGTDIIEENFGTVGIVKDFGPIPADGCGWLIEIQNTAYRPVNLTSEFRRDNLPVDINFKKLNESDRCGLGAVEIEKIELLRIEVLEHTVFSYDQTQCSDAWTTGPSPEETILALQAYLMENGIAAYTIWLDHDNIEGVCTACTCPTGRIFMVAVDPTFEGQMEQLGFDKVGA